MAEAGSYVQHPRCSLHQPRLCNTRVADSSVLGTPESEPGAGYPAGTQLLIVRRLKRYGYLRNKKNALGVP